MSTEITINQDIVEINVTEQVVTIEAPSGAYPLPNLVSSVFGRVGAVVAQEGDYTLTQLGDVTIATPSNGQVLRYNGTTWVNATESFAGTVTSVNMSVPTGLTISGNPITTSGTLAVGLGAGYVIPTQAALDAKQDDLNGTGIVKSTAGTITYLSDNTANWNTAYNDSITSAAVTGTTTKTLTLNQQDGGSITASWTDINTDAVTSVFGRTGAVVATSGDYTTTQVTEGTNLYFTDARARAAISLTTTGTSGASTYNNTTGVLNIPQYQGVLTNPVTGTGTTNTLPKFTAASTIGNSNITDSGSLITLGSNSFVNGLFGVGSSPVGSSSNFYVSNNITGGTSWNTIYLLTNVLSDVTSQARGFVSNIGTQAATFTLSNLTHYRSEQGTFRAGSTVTTQVGYLASGSLVGATNNYGFQGSIPSGTNRWNLFMDGTAANYLAGQLLIGTTTTSAFALDVNGTARVIGNLTVGNTTNAWNSGYKVIDISNSGIYNANTTSTYYSTNFFVNNAGNSTYISTGTAAAIGVENGSYVFYNAASGTAGTTLSFNERFRIALTGAATFSSSVSAASFIPTSSTIPTNGMYLSGTNTLGFATNGTLDMVLNEAGTLGLGLTPASNWGRTGFEIGVAGASITREVRDLVLLSNSIWTSSGLVYAATAGAGRFDVGVSSFRWYTAPSGTGGNAITFTQAMTLDNNGALGIGTTNLTGYSLRVDKNITGQAIFSGGSFGVGIWSGGTVQSDEVGGAAYFRTFAQTQAATFNAGTITHFDANQGTFGTNSTVGTQIAFFANSNLIGATNNFGFYGNIPTGTNRWNLYMNGTANNYMAGNLGIGSTSVDTTMLRISRSFTSTLTGGILLDGQISSTGTGQTNYFQTSASTAAASFTAASIRHINIQQGTFGAGSTVTNQFGVFVGASMVGATSNFGFFGDIPSGTNRWNLYMAGTADNYMAGKLGIGTTSSYVSSRLVVSGSAANGAIVSEDTASTGSFIRILADTSNGNLINYRTGTALRFATSNNDFSSFAEAARFNSSGSFGIGTGASINASARLQVDSTTQGFLPPRMTTTQKNAIGTPAAGLMVYDTTLNQMSYYNGTTWINF